MVDGMSIREVSRVFGLHRDTVRKILAYSVPPRYRRQTPPRRPNPSTSSGVPYSTRPSGSLCRATYSDHEGLDFHWNRHAAVHWNRPPNSVDLEQREGHAHRYHGRAVLKNIARKVGERDKAKAKAVLSRAEPISRGSWPAVSSMMSSRPNGVSVPSQKVTRGSAPVARSCRCCAGCRPGSCATAVTGRIPRGLRAGTIG